MSNLVRTHGTVQGRVSRPLVAIAVATVAALAVWGVARLSLGVEPTVGSGGRTQSVGAGAVLLASVLVGLAGWGLAAALDRFTRRSRPIWTVIASVLLLASLLGPLGGVDNGSRITLILLHLVVGGVLIAGFSRRPAGT